MSFGTTRPKAAPHDAGKGERKAATAQGTAGEDRVDLSREDSRAVRQRSVQLLRVLLRPVRLRFAITVALVVLSQAAKVAGPLLIAFGIDAALPALTGTNRDWFLLALTGGGYVVAALSAAWLTAAYLTATAQLSQAMLLDLRLQVFRHTQRLSMEFHEKYTSGRIISRQTSDLEALRELLDSGISSLASGLVFMLLTAASIFALDWPTGLLILTSAVPMFLLARWYQKRSQAAYRSSRVVSAGLIVHFVETMTGIRAVQAFRREKDNATRYDELAEEYRSVAVRSINLNGVFQPGLVLIGNVAVAAVLLVGGGTGYSIMRWRWGRCWPCCWRPNASSNPSAKWRCSTIHSNRRRRRWRRCPDCWRRSPPCGPRITLSPSPGPAATFAFRVLRSATGTVR